MARLKAAGEPRRTAPTRPHAPRAPRAPPEDARVQAFREHEARTVAFTEELRALRCRATDHFDARIGETVDAFRPLFAPWSAEIVFYVYMHGPQRFNALKRGLDGISSRVLTDKLRHLEAEAYVARGEAYALTPHGERVARMLHPLVFYLHNRERLDAPPDAAQAPAQARAPG